MEKISHLEEGKKVETGNNSEILENQNETKEQSSEILVVLNIQKLTKELGLVETPEIKKLGQEVSELMKNLGEYSELDSQYGDEIRKLESFLKNKSEKTQIAVGLMTAKVRINGGKFEEALEDLNAMADFAYWMSCVSAEYKEISNKINDIIKLLK